MDVHFQSCKHCASVLAGVRNVVQLYGDERMLEVPAGFSSRIAETARKKRGGAGKQVVNLVGMAGAAGRDGFNYGNFGDDGFLTFEVRFDRNTPSRQEIFLQI